VECEQADRARNIVRQGDVLAAHPGTANWANRWRRFFVVLSADCDIVNKKLDTGLVVVPVIGLQTYALDVWLPEQIRRNLANAEKKTESLMRRFGGWTASPSVVLSMTEQELGAELEVRVAAGDELGNPADSLKSIRNAFQTLRELEEAVLAGQSALGDLVTKFCVAKSSVIGNSVDPQKELKAGLAAVADHKRTDLWPLCDLVGLDGQMREDERDGFVAALRRFTQIPLENALIDKNVWLSSRDSYFRICRLRGIYKSDFLYRFASLFTRVGLDAGRDDEHQRMFDLATARALKMQGDVK
jgi:hypothetical protein